MPVSRAARESNYYAKDRWPVYDFSANPLPQAQVLIAKKTKTTHAAPIPDGASENAPPPPQ